MCCSLRKWVRLLQIKVNGQVFNSKTFYQVPNIENCYVKIDGSVWRKNKNGEFKPRTPYRKSSSKKYVAKVYGKEYLVSTLMQRTFIGTLKDGYVIYHVNGFLNDNSLKNLEIISRVELGKKTGLSSGRKFTIAKISKDGEVVDFYRSAREAGVNNHMSYQTILDRVNGKVKSLFAPDGYIYVRDNMYSINSALKQLKESKS